MPKTPLWATAVLALAVQAAPAGNLLVNGDARQGTAGWTGSGVARIERLGGVPCFTVRAGSFHQEVELPGTAIGMYAAVVGKGQAERVNADGSITGLPYLYGMVSAADRTKYLAYWQGQNMRARPEQPGQWVTMSGIFSVPYGAAYLSIKLQQATRKGDPQDGSAARFSDVRVQLFPTEDAARAFIGQYR